jgi:crotonobetainyl-CoA:carnitine CoA-transferase CaiB-like acyl-CoA transferase
LFLWHEFLTAPGYRHLKDEFPSLVYCSITGFGQTGPYSPRPGYDALVQAMGGYMSVTGEPEGEPMKVGVPVQDLYAGLHGVIGILAALRHASLTGEGQHVEAGLQIASGKFDACAWFVKSSYSVLLLLGLWFDHLRRFWIP